MAPLPLLSLIGSGLQGVATVIGGRQQAKGLAGQALASRIDGEMATLRATQTKERSRAQLDGLLGTISALRSTRGAGLDSPTAMVIEGTTYEDAYREEGIEVLAEMQRRAAALAAERGYRTASRWAVPISVMQASGSFAQALGGLGSPGGAPGALNIKSGKV